MESRQRITDRSSRAATKRGNAVKLKLDESYLGFAHQLADLAGHAIRPYFRRSLRISNKAVAGFDPVTAADRAAERAMRAAITRHHPEHGIVGEEFATKDGATAYRWILDPIDGTRAFIMGSPLWGTLIGLVEGDRPVLGLMDQPFTRERFWGTGRRALMRTSDGQERRLKTRACPALAQAILTTTHPDLFATPGEAASFDRVSSRARMVRYGGDCYGYALLAAGFVDIVVESGLKSHDVAALIPIIEGAGGQVSTWDGKPALDGGRILATGDARVHREAMAFLKGYDTGASTPR